jgi:hypothetical protein
MKGGTLTKNQENILIKEKNGKSMKERDNINGLIRNLKILPNKLDNPNYINNIIQGYINKKSDNIVSYKYKISNEKNLNLNFINIGLTTICLTNKIKNISYKYNNFNDLIIYIKNYIGNDNILAQIMCGYYVIYNNYNIYPERMSKINNSNLTISYFKNMNPKELAEYILETKSGIHMINKFKPVGTLRSQNFSTNIFYILWYKFTEKERIDLKNELSILVNEKINIYLGKDNKSAIFYSEKYFPILASVYGYTLEKALDIFHTRRTNNNNNYLDFIYTSFGDKYIKNYYNYNNNNNKSINNERINNNSILQPNYTELTENGQKKFNKYLSIIGNNARNNINK